MSVRIKKKLYFCTEKSFHCYGIDFSTHTYLPLHRTITISGLNRRGSRPFLLHEKTRLPSVNGFLLATNDTLKMKLK